MRRYLLLFACVWSVSAPAWAAIAFVQAPTAVVTASGTTHQITITSVTAASLLVCHAGYISETITSTIADDKTNTWNVTVGPIDHSGATDVRAYQWFAMNVAAGTTIITITTSLAIAIFIHCEEYSGAHLTAALDTGASSNGSAEFTVNAAPTMNLTTTGTGIIVGFFRATSNKNLTAGSNYTVRDTSTRADTEDRAVTAGVYAVDAAYDATESGLILAATYLEAAGDGGGGPSRVGSNLLLGVGR